MKNYVYDDEFKSQIQQIEHSFATESFSSSFKKFINLRELIFDENNYQLNTFWNKFSTFIAQNMTSTIEYLDNECTASEFSWLSEIFDDVFEKTESKEFLNCIKKTAERFPEECKKYNIIQIIKDLV